MGLLDNTNPNATRRSLLRWAFFGAVVGPLFTLLIIWEKVPLRFWWIILLLASIVGAAAIALVEWQLDDELDENEEQE